MNGESIARRQIAEARALSVTAAEITQRPLHLRGAPPPANAMAFRPRYSTLPSISHCPGPVVFAEKVNDFPASDAALPTAAA